MKNLNEAQFKMLGNYLKEKNITCEITDDFIGRMDQDDNQCGIEKCREDEFAGYEWGNQNADLLEMRTILDDATQHLFNDTLTFDIF